MKILYALHQFFPLHYTGTERLTLDIAKQIQRMGNFVSVLTYEPSSPLEKSPSSKVLYKADSTRDDGFEKLDNNLKKKEYQIDTIPVISFKHVKHTWGFQIFDQHMEKFLPEIIKKFDIIHFTHPMRFASALKTCKQLGKQTILTLTDPWLLCPRGLITTDFQLCDGPDEGRKCMSLCHYDKEVLSRYENAKFFFDNIDIVVAGSRFLQHTFRDNDWKRKIELIPFSIDHSHIKRNGDPKELVFAFMGTLIWHKGIHVLIEAFKKVENKNIKLKIFGRGDERDPYIKDLINSAESDSRVEFCGTFNYEDLPNVMKEISIMVIPSTYKDNFPLVMQLSLAYGKPVIASKIGGMPEVIKDGINGILFEPGNSEQLAKIIYSLSENPQKILNLKKGINPPPRIEEEALRYENLYRELLKGDSDKHPS